MSKDKISDYSTTANSNTDIGGINVDEGCAPSGINDAIRTLMAQLKTWQSGGQDVYIHPAGTASAPSITANGDTNTGIFFPAADTIAFAEGGVEAMRLDSAGNMGLGVTPSATSVANVMMQMKGGAVYSSNSTNMKVLGNAFFNGTNFIYQSNGFASQYSQGDGVGAHSWHTAASGTAGNAISFTQAMTLDASGRLGIGTTSPSSQLHIYPSTANVFTEGLRVNREGQTGQYTIVNYASGIGRVVAVDSLFNSPSLGFFTSSDGSTQTERARIDSSGNLLVNTTTTNGKISVITTAQTTLYVARTETSAANNIVLANGNGNVGFIQTSGSSTSYLTSSDYRLKEDVQPMTGALAAVAALKPCTYKWKIDGSAGQGFIAHELQTVVPDCVSGEKDAVDENGDIVPQSIDTSFLVATLTAAIQELKAEFDAYKASHP